MDKKREDYSLYFSILNSFFGTSDSKKIAEMMSAFDAIRESTRMTNKEIEALTASIESAIKHLQEWLKPLVGMELNFDKLKTLQTIHDIGLDLRPYGNASLEDVINALDGQRPCDYKEILDRKFLSSSKKKDFSNFEKYERIVFFVCTILNTVIQFCILLTSLNPGISDEEFRRLADKWLVPFIKESIQKEIESQQSPNESEPESPVLIKS